MAATDNPSEHWNEIDWLEYENYLEVHMLEDSPETRRQYMSIIVDEMFVKPSDTR